MAVSRLLGHLSSPPADRVLEQELIPVQRAINSLAASGAQLEAGDVKAASAALRWALGSAQPPQAWQRWAACCAPFPCAPSDFVARSSAGIVRTCAAAVVKAAEAATSHSPRQRHCCLARCATRIPTEDASPPLCLVPAAVLGCVSSRPLPSGCRTPTPPRPLVGAAHVHARAGRGAGQAAGAGAAVLACRWLRQRRCPNQLGSAIVWQLITTRMLPAVRPVSCQLFPLGQPASPAHFWLWPSPHRATRPRLHPLPTHPPPAVGAVFSNLSALQSAASSGSAADSKRSFVATVGSLKAWASDANVASELKGI